MTLVSDLAPAGRSLARLARDWLRLREQELLGVLTDLVGRDSPTGDPAGLGACSGALAQLFGSVGDVTVHAVHGRQHLQVDVGDVLVDGHPLVMCHYDTVWPAGTADAWPLSLNNGIVRGPGVLDMKASIAMTLFALRAVQACQAPLPGGARVLLTADEEEGNPTSRELIRELSRQAAVALVLEPPLPDGRLKTQRKGVAHVMVRLTGRAAHAGIEPEAGASAALAAARFALAASELAAAAPGASVNVGVLRAGERRNVVAERGELELDVRAFDEQTIQLVLDALTRAAAETKDGVAVEVTTTLRRPPLVRADAVDLLLEIARYVADPLGMSIREGESGGGSEGNLVAAVGVPVLDGLGAEGGGAHSRGEHVLLASVLQRTAFLAGLIRALSGLRAKGPAAAAGPPRSER